MTIDTPAILETRPGVDIQRPCPPQAGPSGAGMFIARVHPPVNDGQQAARGFQKAVQRQIALPDQGSRDAGSWWR